MAAGYISKLNENVTREHVRYNNRYGIAIAADVYTAKDLDKSKKHPALIVGAPYGEDVYYYYLQAMIAAENSETQRYNKRMTLFNAAYQEWTDFYNRTH